MRRLSRGRGSGEAFFWSMFLPLCYVRPIERPRGRLGGIGSIQGSDEARGMRNSGLKFYTMFHQHSKSVAIRVTTFVGLSTWRCVRRPENFNVSLLLRRDVAFNVQRIKDFTHFHPTQRQHGLSETKGF